MQAHPSHKVSVPSRLAVGWDADSVMLCILGHRGAKAMQTVRGFKAVPAACLGQSA